MFLGGAQCASHFCRTPFVEFGHLKSMSTNNVVEILPHDKFYSDVYRLHIAKGDGYDTAVSVVIHVVAHGGPIFDTFDVVKH